MTVTSCDLHLDPTSLIRRWPRDSEDVPTYRIKNEVSLSRLLKVRARRAQIHRQTRPDALPTALAGGRLEPF